MLAKEIMRSQVVTVPPGMALGEVAEVLAESRISGAPVVDARGELLGVVSQTDLLRQKRAGALLASRYRARAKARDVMTPRPYCCDENTPVKDLARELLKRRIHRAIVTRAGRIAGIVTSMDLVRAVAERSSDLASEGFFQDFIELTDAELGDSGAL